jgi:signal transduction histidine kinase/ligand-binding sensor domain-containing protein/DNA-binding response OmpR family regulator
MRNKDLTQILIKTTVLIWLQMMTQTAVAVHFRPIDVKDGLADNFVRDITTDSEGYVWLSTINGLSRYDGYRFLNFQPQQWGGRSGDVTMVRETQDGTLWMLCSGELLTYCRDSQTWQKDGEERLKQMGIVGTVCIFYVDDEGSLWVATEKGLWHVTHGDRSRGVTAEFTGPIPTGCPIRHIVAKNGTTLVVTADYKIYKVSASGKLTLLTQHPKPDIEGRDCRAMLDSRMNLWLYHAHEEATGLWVWSLGSGEWRQPEALKRLDNDVTVNAMTEDYEGRLWVGTGNHGVYVIEWHGSDVKTMLIPMSRHITCLYADRNNTMWAGMAKFGAAYADLNSPEFIHITTDGREDVSALMEDAQGNLWIGFDGHGTISAGRSYSTRNGQLLSDDVTALATDGQGNILVGTYGGGIARFNGNQFVPLYKDHDRINYVKAMVTDRYGALWVATVDKGVVRIINGRFTYFTEVNSPLRSDGITCLAYDSASDRIYIGTSIGLAAYDCLRGNFIKDEGLDSLKNVNVTALLTDSEGRLWIGSRDGLWIKGQKLLHLTTEQGLSHNVVRALAISGGTTWVSTDNGLTSVTPEEDALKCRPFFDTDGLHGIIFSNNAALTTRNGTVLLGSQTGYVNIPSEGVATMNLSLPRVVFTEYRINGNPVVMSPPQDFTIDYGEHLGICISIMVPSLSHKAHYLYRFKDEDEWMRAPGNMLYFTSLMPGTHVLQVKCELTGVATTEVSELTFQVRPPFWLSKWAIICYFLLLVSFIWFVWRAIRRRQKREVAMKQMEINLKKYEMEKDKIRFFTNISHDLKTPLTLVVAPLEKIREHNLPEAIRTEIDVAWRNARQLYDLVLELLDFRRLDVGKEKLLLSHGDLVGFIRQTAQAFAYYTTRKQIDLLLELPETALETLFDENKMRRIITNLLSNAYKYNVDGGSVTVGLQVNEKEVILSVADTGIGVKDKKHIFDRFVQETHGQEQEGNGLGLHIVRQYVNMMDGSITVIDNQPRGTVFTVKLPLKERLESKDERCDDSQGAKEGVLVVEDNTDARLFLQRSLEDEYHVLTAANGKEALSLLENTDNVSIIISDVMMPTMDGIEFVRQIRKNIRFSHIPVILLTAKSSEEDIIAGLKEGVADYLTKPYSLAVLRMRIKKILEWTRHVHEQVATGIDIKPSEITVSSLDEELISHVIAEVEANISDQNYSVVQLSAAVGMTRGTLYKKLMAIVGKSPVEFIRIVRLKRGKDLLDQGRTNVSEVADKVGYSPKMFAQYFRETYGQTPSEYLKQHKTINNKII